MSSVEVEDVVEERALLLLAVPGILVPQAVVIAGPLLVAGAVVLVGSLIGRSRRRGRRRPVLAAELAGGALDDLVELTAVEPDTATGRAVVDLDTLAIGHEERGAVSGTQHARNLSGARRLLGAS